MTRLEPAPRAHLLLGAQLIGLLALCASCAATPGSAPPEAPPLPRPESTPPRTSPTPPPSSRPAEVDEDALKQANNPLANMTTIKFQNYAITETTGTDDSANQFWVRYAQPIETPGGTWLMRASMPLLSVPVGNDNSESGIGDSNVFAAYLMETDDPAVSLGVGPLVGVPTGTKDVLGTDQWSLGAAAVYFDARSELVQFGGLVTYQHKLFGSGRAPDVNLLAIQPFGMLQLGKGVYFRSVGIWAFDLQQGNYNIPVGFGLGKVVKAGDMVLNFYLEPQFTVLHDGPGQPEYQVLFGFNTQFLGM